MTRLTSGLAASIALLVAGCTGMTQTSSSGMAPTASTGMSFFITSTGSGKGADFGGLAGADKHCQTLAAAAGAGGKTWHAYLSTQGAGAVNARDRIGKGPWRNAKGVVVANNLDELHGTNNLGKQTSLTEKGDVVNGRGDTPNRHDILTGSQRDGTAFPGARRHDVRQLDEERRRRRHARPPRPERHQSRSGRERVVERVAQVRRLQRRSAGQDRQRRLPVLLRDELIGRDARRCGGSEDPGSRFAAGSAQHPQSEVDDERRRQQHGADDDEPQHAVDEVRVDAKRHPCDQRHELRLPLAVHEVADADRAGEDADRQRGRRRIARSAGARALEHRVDLGERNRLVREAERTLAPDLLRRAQELAVGGARERRADADTAHADVLERRQRQRLARRGP